MSHSKRRKKMEVTPSYTSVHWTRFAYAGIVAAAVYLLHVLIGLGSYVHMTAWLAAAGMFLFIPPRLKEEQFKAELEQERRWTDLSLSMADMDRRTALERLDAFFVPRLKNSSVMRSTRRLLTELDWVVRRWESLVDHPEHQATINLTVRQFLPDTLRKFIDLSDLDGNAQRRVVASTKKSIKVLEAEVLRIKLAILEDRLHGLEGHAEALEKVFGKQTV